tara:strand:+ start:1021 stop:1359 length:339 start_codon:yes stop_codon:yes gene_type:complete
VESLYRPASAEGVDICSSEERTACWKQSFISLEYQEHLISMDRKLEMLLVSQWFAHQSRAVLDKVLIMRQNFPCDLDKVFGIAFFFEWRSELCNCCITWTFISESSGLFWVL